MPPRVLPGSILEMPDPLSTGRGGLLQAANYLEPSLGAGAGWRSWADALDPTASRFAFGSYGAPATYRQWGIPDVATSYREGLANFRTYQPFSPADTSYDPLPRGLTDRPLSLLLSPANQYARDIEDWLRREFPELVIWSGTPGQGNPGEIASPGGDWAPVDRWDDFVLAAVRQVYQETSEQGDPVYVPPNLVKAIMRLESEGDPQRLSPAGAIGLMQVMPFWFDDYGIYGADRFDPYTNILMGVRILAINYKLGNPATNEPSWEWAARRYLGLGGADDYGTTHDTYWAVVSKYWEELDAAAPTSTPGALQIGEARVNIPGYEGFTDEINAEINAAAQKYGVPANLIKAVIRHASARAPYEGATYSLNHRDEIVSYVGITRSLAEQMGLDWAKLTGSRAGAIEELARLLRLYASAPEIGGRYGWEGVIAQHFGGAPDPAVGARDAYGRDLRDLLETIMGDWSRLDTVSWTQSSRSTQATTQFNAIWGGFDAPISQEFGRTEFSIGNPWYSYTTEYTRDRSIIHAGVDVGIKSFTPLFSPVAGTVVIAGGSGSYCDPGQPELGDPGYGCGPGVGELRIRVDGTNDELILGHMRQITVKVGDRVTPGQYVGVSGNMNGAHVHVEYRRWVGEGVTDSGWEVVDPRLALSGVFVGAFGEVTAPTLGVSADDWRSFVRGAIEGRPLIGHGVGGFHDWLRGFLGVGSAPRLFEPENVSGWVLNASQLPRPGRS